MQSSDEPKSGKPRQSTKPCSNMKTSRFKLPADSLSKLDRTAHFYQPKKGSLMEALSSLPYSSQAQKEPKPASRNSPPASGLAKSPTNSYSLLGKKLAIRPRQS